MSIGMVMVWGITCAFSSMACHGALGVALPSLCWSGGVSAPAAPFGTVQ